MIVRIVKMTFRKDEIEKFRSLFVEVKGKIEEFPGCREVTLLQDIDSPEIFFTHSLWNKLESLDSYRHSDLFRATWKKTKALFKTPPQAWSLQTAVME